MVSAVVAAPFVPTPNVMPAATTAAPLMVRITCDTKALTRALNDAVMDTLRRSRVLSSSRL